MPGNDQSPHGNRNPLGDVIARASSQENPSWCTCSEEVNLLRVCCLSVPNLTLGACVKRTELAQSRLHPGCSCSTKSSITRRAAVGLASMRLGTEGTQDLPAHGSLRHQAHFMNKNVQTQRDPARHMVLKALLLS